MNITLGSLLDQKPDIVVSGINIGHNVTLPLILCSGTIAGALEGAVWRLPAIAFSKEIPADSYHEIRKNKGFVRGNLKESLQASAAIATEIALKYASQKVKKTIVHNINFPQWVTKETEKKFTRPEEAKIGSIFRKKGKNSFIFNEKFSLGTKPNSGTDRDCLLNGIISHTQLNYSNIAQLD